MKEANTDGELRKKNKKSPRMSDKSSGGKSSGYDFRMDYEYNDYDTDFAFNQEDQRRQTGSTNNQLSASIRNKMIAQYPKDLSTFCDWIISTDEYKPDFIYTWTDRDSWVARLFLILRLLKVKKVKTRISRTPKSSMTKMNNSDNARRNDNKNNNKAKNKDKFQNESDIRKANRINEQNYIKKLDKSSIEYKTLSMDQSKLRRISKSELSKHIIPSLTHVKKYSLEENSEGLWMLIHGFVFDISELLDSHPGGVECLLDCVGVDATRVFDDVGHSDIAWEMMENSCVGIMDYMVATDDEEVYKDDEDDEDEREDEDNVLGNKTVVQNDDNDLLILTETETEIDIVKIKSSRYRLVWNDIGLEYLLFIATSLLGFICFIYLQRKKWDEWGNWSG